MHTMIYLYATISRPRHTETSEYGCLCIKQTMEPLGSLLTSARTQPLPSNLTKMQLPVPAFHPVPLTDHAHSHDPGNLHFVAVAYASVCINALYVDFSSFFHLQNCFYSSNLAEQSYAFHFDPVNKFSERNCR